MSETPIVTDGSAVELEEVEQNDPLTGNDTVDKSDETSEDRAVDPRLAIMEQIAARNDEDRRIQSGTRQEDMPAGEPVPEFEADDSTIESGLESQESFIEDAEDPEGLPEEYEDDPLAEFIEMQGDEPMFRTVVNGQQQLIPLEQARATIQKNHAADQRLQEASRIQQDLAYREQKLVERENELLERSQTPEPSADVPDEQLVDAARNVVGELFTGTQDEAAEKLADLLLKTRGVKTTSVDPQQIAAQAVTAARQQLAAEQRDQDAHSGYKKFTKDYPEIAADDMLFRLADSMTDEIAQNHPDWMPSAVMLEAGKRTREWVKSQDKKASEQTPAQDDRRERKRNLRRVPRARQGVQPAEPVERQETPTDFMAEIRKARGQVV
jgi:hypothetical protein